MRWLETRIPPPIVAACFALLAWLFAPVEARASLAASSRIALGVAIALLGGAIAAAGSVRFHRAKTTVNPLHPEKASALVTTGIYRYTRNPMYVGMACLLLAWALHLSAWLPVAGPALFVLYITRFQILPEERTLQQLFGDAYTQYTSRVRRWL